jgi:DNA-binding beta-propeller fold protein YncE
MKRAFAHMSFLISACALVVWAASVLAQDAAPLKQIATIALPNVSGRMDHLGFDAASGRLFIAALENNTVEVLDTRVNQHLRSLTGFREPQGVAVAADFNAVAVANGESGTLQLLDVKTLQTRWTVEIGDDADNVRYDASARRFYVAARGGLSAVDPVSGRVTGLVAIAGHPESFQFEVGGSRVFANVPGILSHLIGAGHVVIADRNTMSTTGTWSVCGANYPMALDETGRRLFVGCRRPASIVMLETQNGKTLATFPTTGHTDDLFYDADGHRLYVIGGQGTIDVFARESDALRRIANVPTREGARTGLWAASLRRLFVAVPAAGSGVAEIRVFEAQH